MTLNEIFWGHNTLFVAGLVGMVSLAFGVFWARLPKAKLNSPFSAYSAR